MRRFRRTVTRLGLVGSLAGIVVLAGLAGSSAAADPPAGCTTTAGVTTCVFAYTGAAQTWTVPAGVTSATFDVFGAQGGSFLSCCAGGMGGEATATLSVTAGSSVEILVGGTNGFNGGGAGGAALNPSLNGAAGGGASDIRFGSCAASSTCALTDRVLVAGGGGGGGFGAAGGGGGNPTGSVGSTNMTSLGGGGGTQSQPGAGGGSTCAGNGQAGALAGGTGGAGGGAQCGIGGGGGGGGYYGGGGGGGGTSGSAGGGGGSSFGAGATFQTAVRTGNGLITVTFAAPTAVALRSASAVKTPKGVVVRWRTATEVDLVGFHVYRLRGRSWRRLTPSLIAAKGSVSGSSYRFLDRTAARDAPSRYRIKALNRDGTTDWIGPLRAS